MRPEILDFVKICEEVLNLKDPIYEFGALQLPGQETMDEKILFPHKKYIGTDMREGKGVDFIIDLHNINLRSESVDTALCFDVYEHVEHPRKATEEIHRVLKPDGVFIMTTVMWWPIHDYPADYWRFTPEGMKSLLKIFKNYFVLAGGKEDFPPMIAAVAFKGDVDPKIYDELYTKTKAWAEGLPK